MSQRTAVTGEKFCPHPIFADISLQHLSFCHRNILWSSEMLLNICTDRKTQAQ